ncbi:MAG TPA: tripartite tricarboxylate transporter substrate binding protein [Xanthobacteraceae bacterium]|nr:tripartite tricarboxylate transporter substrate binding protein [Xanthobacteraceae bacterium]
MKSVASSVLLAAVLATTAGGACAADEYPSRIVKLVVAAPAGGGIDIVARLIERVMSQNLGQKIIIDNRVGANGFLGAAFVASAPPDGYTIFTTVSGPVTNPLNAPISYDVETAFQPISRVMASPFFLVVPQSSKLQTVAELIAAGKDPNQVIRYGHPGLGTVTHMASVLFNKMAGTKFVDIPYRGSAGQVQDTLSGELQFGLLAAPDALSRRNEGLRILAVSTAKRSILAPDVPTIAESGVPGYEFELWHGLFAPAKTPRPIIERIRGALAAAQEDQETRARFLALGMVPTLDTPEDFAALVREQRTKDSALAKELNLKPQ